MSYIGRGTESISNVEVLDNLTFDGSASYTLQKSSVNFVPSSANNLLISISGVVQQGNFSVSGSTITFDTTVSASDTCDWILHYGTGLITTVADGAITEAKLGNNAVTASKIDSSVALGKIGQVVTGTYTSSGNTSSSSFVDTGAGVFSITPSSTSSKILIDFGCSPHVNTGSASNNVLRGLFTIYRDINGGGYSNLATSTGIAINRVGDSMPYSNTQDITLRVKIADTPNTTSQVNYKLYYATTAGDVYYNLYGNTHTITLMEVLA